MISEKKEFIAVDYMKLMCALLIVGLHTNVFKSVNSEAVFLFNEIISRIGVPFFFLASGFFVAEKLEDGAKLMQYIKRLLLLYLIYSLIYLPQMILVWKREGRAFWECVIIFFRKFFLVGTYGQLWYFVGLAIAVLCLYLLVKVLKLPLMANITIASVLYIIGVLGSAYKTWFAAFPAVRDILLGYYDIFETTRNGVFFGLLYVMSGYYLRTCAAKIKKGKIYLFLTVLFFGMLTAEAYFARGFVVAEGFDMMFSLFPLSICLFLAVCSVQISEQYLTAGRKVRNISTLIYGFHLCVEFYVTEILCIRLGINVNSIVWYILIAVLNLLLAGVILWLSQYKFFKWLRLLY